MKLLKPGRTNITKLFPAFTELKKTFPKTFKVLLPDAAADTFDPVEGKLTKLDPRVLIPDWEFQDTLNNVVVNKYLEHPNYHDPENSFGSAKANERYDHPRVINYKGMYFLKDGHHRVAAAIIRGDKSIKVLLKKRK